MDGAIAVIAGLYLRLAIAAALAVFGLFVWFGGGSPTEAWLLLFRGAFGDAFSWQNTLQRAAPLMLTGLAVALPAQAGRGHARRADREFERVARSLKLIDEFMRFMKLRVFQLYQAQIRPGTKANKPKTHSSTRCPFSAMSDNAWSMIPILR